jgi:hypothetical protein
MQIGRRSGQVKVHWSFFYTISSTPITWNTKKQTHIALLPKKSNYHALVKAIKKAI